MKGVAAALIILGIVALAWGGLQWTQKEKVVDLGPIEVNKEKEHSIPLPPVVGVVALAAGAVLLLRK